MSSITAADLKLGGRLVAAADAMAENHLRRAAGIFAEIADDLNTEAETTDGLMVEEEQVEWPVKAKEQSLVQSAPSLTVGQPMDLQSCARNVHNYGPVDPITGWRTCSSCGIVNVAPPGDGPIDMGARNL